MNTILFGLYESSKIRFYSGDNWVHSYGKEHKKQFPANMVSIIFPTRSLIKVIFDDSNIPERIVQMNVLHFIYSFIVLVICIFDINSGMKLLI